jgi:hypothetical protein
MYWGMVAASSVERLFRLCLVYRRIVCRPIDSMPDMETPSPPPPRPETLLEQLVALVRTRRSEFQSLLAAHQARLERAEASLERQLGTVQEGRQSAGVWQEPAEPEAAVVGLTGQGSPVGGRLDWEAEKRRILAAFEAETDPADVTQRLEANFDASPQTRRVEPSPVNVALQCSEQVIVQRDREIEELKQRLTARQRPADSEPGEAAGSDPLLDNDTAVLEERQRLQQLQEECRKKLCQAEVDLAVERARLARQRAELDERSRRPNTDAPSGPAKAAGTDPAQRPVRRRWLAQLGISDDDERPSKR